MTRIAILGAMAALVLLFAGYSLGRWVQPARIVERAKTVEVSRAAEHNEKSASAERLATANVVTRWRTRVLRLPDGTTVRESEADTARSSSSGERAAAATAEAKTVEVVKEVERLKVVENRADWGVSAYGGLDLSAKQIFGGRIERRLFGPVKVGLQADSRLAAMITVGVEF